MVSEKQMISVQQKKERVLQSAILLFSKNNYDGTTMADIAKHAGVSFGSVSSYFGNKEELYNACINQIVLELFEQMLDFNAEATNVKEELLNMIRNQIKLIANRKEQLILMSQVTDSCDRFPTAFKVLNEATVDIQKKIVQLLANGQEQGQIEEGNFELIAISYTSLLLGMRLAFADNPTDEFWENCVPIAYRLFGPK